MTAWLSGRPHFVAGKLRRQQPSLNAHGVSTLPALPSALT